MNPQSVSWSNLPNELIEKIGKSLDIEIDVSRFRAVCQSWRYSVPLLKPSLALPISVPLLLYADSTPHGFSFLTKCVFYRLQLPPTGENWTAASTSSPSSKSWLVRVEEAENRKPLVVDPLSEFHLNQFPNSFPKVINLLEFRVFELGNKAYRMQTSYSGSYKAVFNESSSSTMLVICNILCYVKLGDEDWTVIDDMQSQMDFEDVIYEEGKLYAVDSLGRAVAVDSNLVIQEIAFSIYDRRGCGQVHQMRLVMSLGDLFLVDRYPAEYDRVQFKVFKFNWSFRVWMWVRNLGDQALFIGEDCSFALSAQDFYGFIGNCVYVGPNFAVNKWGLTGSDNGVYSLEYDTFLPLMS